MFKQKKDTIRECLKYKSTQRLWTHNGHRAMIQAHWPLLVLVKTHTRTWNCNTLYLDLFSPVSGSVSLILGLRVRTPSWCQNIRMIISFLLTQGHFTPLFKHCCVYLVIVECIGLGLSKKVIYTLVKGALTLCHAIPTFNDPI